MKRRSVWSLGKSLAGSIALVTVAMVSALSPLAVGATANSYSYFFDFNKTIAPWMPGTTNRLANEETLRLVHDPEPTSALGTNGVAVLTGQMPYAVWMMAGFRGAGNMIQVSFMARARRNCLGCQPIVYVGTSFPKRVTAFQMVGGGLTEEWQAYIFEAPLAAEKVAVAIGYANLDMKARDAVSNVQQMDIDNVHVDMYNYVNLPPR